MCDEDIRVGVEGGGGTEFVGEVKRRLGVPKRGVSEAGDRGRRFSITEEESVEEKQRKRSEGSGKSKDS